MATSGGAGPQEAALKIVGEADDEAARTYVFRGEDHTLGNALRHVLMRQKDVEFCGYSVPHPSEPFVHVRLQTTGAPARAVLDDGRTVAMKVQYPGVADSIVSDLWSMKQLITYTGLVPPGLFLDRVRALLCPHPAATLGHMRPLRFPARTLAR